MYTSDLVAMIARTQATGMSRTADILPAVREACQILCKVEADRWLAVNPATGRPYVIATTAGTFGPYDGPDDTWLISNLLVDAASFVCSADYGSDLTQLYDVSNVVTLNGRDYFRHLCCNCVPAEEDDVPQITFSYDPGTTTSKYYAQAYVRPAVVSSESIQLPLPDMNGAHRAIVYPAVMALLEGQQNGNYAEAVKYVQDILGPKAREILNRGSQGKRHSTTPRPY